MRRYSFVGPLSEEQRWLKSLKRWLVCSPKYGTMVPVLDDGSGPTEYGCDVVEIEAVNKRDALILGLKLMRKEYPDGWHNQDLSENPFKGMRVEEYPEEYDILSQEEIEEITSPVDTLT
jgi:hypothetical protein